MRPPIAALQTFRGQEYGCKWSPGDGSRTKSKFFVMVWEFPTAEATLIEMIIAMITKGFFCVSFNLCAQIDSWSQFKNLARGN